MFIMFPSFLELENLAHGVTGQTAKLSEVN